MPELYATMVTFIPKIITIWNIECQERLFINDKLIYLKEAKGSFIIALIKWREYLSSGVAFLFRLFHLICKPSQIS